MDIQLTRITRDPDGGDSDPGWLQNVELIRLLNSKPVKTLRLPDGNKWRYEFTPDNTEWKLCTNFKHLIHDSMLVLKFLTPEI